MTNDVGTAMTNDQKFASLMASLGKDPAAEAAFQRDPISALTAADIPLDPMPPPTPRSYGGKQPRGTAPAPLAPEQATAETYWWGVDLYTNEKLTQDIIGGTVPVTTVGGLIAGALVSAGMLAGPVGAAIGLGFGAAMAVKKYEIELVDNGKGVYWPISWVQWYALLMSVPGGPPTILTAILVFIHPVRN